MKPNRRFDDGFFSPQAMGNLLAPPGSFVRDPTINNGDTYSRPRLQRSSLMISSLKSMNACPPVSLDSFAAFAEDLTIGPDDTPPDLITGGATVSVAQPGAVKGNAILDAISGSIRTIAPAAAQNLIGRTNLTTNNKQLLQQYLQGKLPGYTLNSQGQLVPASPSWMVPALLGLGALALFYVAMRSRKG